MSVAARSLNAAKTSISARQVREPERWVASFRDLQQRLSASSGVAAASGISNAPLSGGFFTGPFASDALSERTWNTRAADYLWVLPGYFDVLRTPLLAGRDLAWADQTSGRRVVVVDETLARAAWPGGDAVGKRLKLNLGAGTANAREEWFDVVGVAQHTRRRELRRIGLPQVYLPVWSEPRPHLTLVVRQDSPATDLAAVVRRWSGEGTGRPVHTIQTMKAYKAAILAEDRAVLGLLGGLAALALLLCVVGVYGVVSYSFSQRTQEIGVRMSLGASRDDVLGLVLRSGAALAVRGVVLGLGLALAVTRALERLVFGVSTVDPVTYAVVSVALVGVALLACWLPARRAARVDPLVALRYE